MPQLFQVLRCYKCLTFQIHQTKKSNKFSCKICNEKQSIKRHYGSGIAKDCRMHVQKLNKMRAEKDGIILEGSSEELETSVNSCEDISDDTSSSKTKRESKWSSYIDVQADKSVAVEPSLEETEQCEKYNSRWQNKKNYSKYKSRKRSSLSKQYNSDQESDCNNTEDIEKKYINNSHIVFGKKTFTTKEDCILTSNENIKLNENPNKRPKFDAPVAKSSKWANFVEDENIEEQSNKDNKISTGISTINIQSMFSLNDESDIDDVLNI